MEIKEKPPDWFNLDYSKKLQLPNNNFIKEDININFGKKQHNDKFNEHFIFTNKIDNFNFKNYSNEYIVNEETLIKEKNEMLKKAKTESSKKAVETKYKNKILNKDKSTVCHKFKIHPNDEQKKIIHLWLNELLEIYNICVDIFNVDNNYFNKGYMKAKVEIFDLMEKKFSCPYDSRTNVVSKFCDNIKSCCTNMKNGNIKSFN
jgi:hypothetical protein